MCGGEAVSDLGVLTPRDGWGETGWTVGGRMRLAVPRQTDWTASGVLDWGFPRSAEGRGGKRRWKKRKEKERKGEWERGWALWLVTHSTRIKSISPCFTVPLAYNPYYCVDTKFLCDSWHFLYDPKCVCAYMCVCVCVRKSA